MPGCPVAAGGGWESQGSERGFEGRGDLPHSSICVCRVESGHADNFFLCVERDLRTMRHYEDWCLLKTKE